MGAVMELVEREIYINGKFAVLYGFDWEKNEAIYRQVCDGKAVFVRVKMNVKEC